MKFSRILLVTILFGYSISALAETNNNVITKMDRDLEEWHLSRLAQVQSDPNTQLKEFASDGCSGGVSEGWVTLSKLVPAFKKKFGEHPPYESCCVDHDRAYWRGETSQGYEKRLQADEVLRMCVMNYGIAHQEEFAQEFSLSPQTIRQNFRIISDMMYYAVRLGGKPCSYLPWRWGYGWPDCPLNNNNVQHE